MKQLLHTPEGVRDIYNMEYGKKLALQNSLQQVLHSYGYQDIQTPTFEYFDVFRQEIRTTPSNELYKFFDREGHTLVLRPDITPSIARVAATLFAHENLPIRLCYTGNIFINHSSYQGRLKESTQLGAELIGVDSPEADAEMLALVINCLQKAGLKNFQIHVGNVDFFHSLIKDTEIKEEEEIRLRELINNHNYFGVEELLNTTKAKKSSREAFALLPELVGGAKILEQAKQIAVNATALKAVKRLEMIYELLKLYDAQQYITFDLSMCGTYGYYTGIIFRGYTYGTGDSIVKGGRYDQLIEKFGKQSPSIGFAIVTDELMSALNRQKIQIPYVPTITLIICDEGRQKEAYSLATEFRTKRKNTEVILKSNEIAIDTYLEYGKRNHAHSMLYIQDTQEILMFNILTGERKVIRDKK
ncbi:MAG: ATP phosphoribosyltransferase regulatory subunit [Lachnospiraceae bacterium]